MDETRTLLLMLLTPASVHASCAPIQALAQEHANDMARRGSMDHSGFASRARRGARAENVAYGVKTKPQAIALWFIWPRGQHETAVMQGSGERGGELKQEGCPLL
jgi:hypothetical protein